VGAHDVPASIRRPDLQGGAVMAKDPRNIRPSARGYTVKDFCLKEDITRRQMWRWVELGIVEVSRVAPRTGLRVHYVLDYDPDPNRTE
jgi:hypothetical protein